MRNVFCKKSVFGILFLVFFFLGTICGVLLFRFLIRDHASWLVAYCRSLSDAGRAPGIRILLFALWPILAAAALGMSDFGYRLLPALCLLRGCTLAYLACAFYASGLMLDGFFFRELLLLPLFFYLCIRPRAGEPCS